mmetsp:Transcript_9999/g.29103  ORF Transcript_9999/g.29103 Transcript_9999/m.29103 type:complete len:93 (+) Transcript_9999:824-1102(+)
MPWMTHKDQRLLNQASHHSRGTNRIYFAECHPSWYQKHNEEAMPPMQPMNLWFGRRGYDRTDIWFPPRAWIKVVSRRLIIQTSSPSLSMKGH